MFLHDRVVVVILYGGHLLDAALFARSQIAEPERQRRKECAIDALVNLTRKKARD